MPKKRAANLKSPIKIPRAKAGDQPATRSMLAMVRRELVELIKQNSLDIKKNSLSIKQNSLDIVGNSRETKSLRQELKADIKRLELKVTKQISEVKAIVHRSNLLVEEQNANNRIVLEGLQAVWERQDRLEKGAS